MKKHARLEQTVTERIERAMQLPYSIKGKGYALIAPNDPDYPFAWSNGQGYRCRYVAWLTGKLRHMDDLVHHRDFNKLNDHPDNLEVMSRDEHTYLHKTAMLAPETRAKISAALKGRSLSEESRKKISAKLQGNTNRANSTTSLEGLQNIWHAAKYKVIPRDQISATLKRRYAAGEIKVTISEEQKAKIAATLKGHGVTDETRQRMKAARLKHVELVGRVPREAKLARRRERKRERAAERIQQQGVTSWQTAAP